MKTKEKRIMSVIYCDVCNKEIKGNYTSLVVEDNKHIDFCSDKCRVEYEHTNGEGKKIWGTTPHKGNEVLLPMGYNEIRQALSDEFDWGENGTPTQDYVNGAMWMQHITYPLFDVEDGGTLDRDKVMEIINEFVDHTAYGPGELTGVKDAADAICSLVTNKEEIRDALSEGEIEKEAKKRYREGFELIAHEAGFIAGANWAIKELTKPKEE
jgi:ribosomal protein L24E